MSQNELLIKNKRKHEFSISGKLIEWSVDSVRSRGIQTGRTRTEKENMRFSPDILLLLCSIESNAIKITEPAPIRGNSRNRQPLETSAEFIDRLLKGYDSNVHPNYYNKKPTNISVNIYINSIDSVESSTMDYKGTLGFYSSIYFCS